jgi:prepilin-type N-terminal cleavage/methylation domain-containing protein
MKRSNGFTLLELMIIIALIGVLFTLLLGVASRHEETHEKQLAEEVQRLEAEIARVKKEQQLTREAL